MNVWRIGLIEHTKEEEKASGKIHAVLNLNIFCGIFY